MEENLIRLVAGAEGEAREASRETEAAGQWRTMAALAASWSVGSFLLMRLDRLGIFISDAAREDLTAHHRIRFARCGFVASRGVELCRRLEERGIPVVIFKGLGAIAHLYAGPGERTIKDVDILIQEADVGRAVGELVEMGLAAEDGGDLARYREMVRMLPGFGGNEALALYSAKYGEVDLHWRFGRNPVQELWPEQIVARAEWKEILGTAARVVSPMDGLALSAHHAIRVGFAPAAMVRDLLDTQRWIWLLTERGELEMAMRHVERCRLSVPVHAMAVLLREQGVMERLAAAGGASEDLVRLFQIQAREGAMGKDLATLADPTAWRKILGGAMGGWRGYRGLMAEFEKKGGRQAVPLWERLSRLVRGAAGLGWRKWRGLRTIAKVKAGYQDLGR